jgi:hypothetical protein
MNPIRCDTLQFYTKKASIRITLIISNVLPRLYRMFVLDIATLKSFPWLKVEFIYLNGGQSISSTTTTPGWASLIIAIQGTLSW